MAESPSYPQIPANAWWGVRELLIKSPTVKIDDNMLASSLDVQINAARAYINELKKVKILDEEGKATPVALKWRMDGNYTDATKEIVESIYPDGLLAIAPPGNAERQKVINWFMNNGLGQGSARNKTATYLLITSPNPSDSSNNMPTSEKKKPKTTSASKPSAKKREKPSSSNGDSSNNSDSGFAMPLNVNVQIHISADASSEQIETIFSSMRKYLGNENAN